MKISINDKEYGLSWGLGAIEIYCDKHDCDLEDIDLHIGSIKAIDRLKALNNLTLAAMQNYAEINGLEFAMGYRDFQEWLNDQPQTIGDAIINDWKASKLMGKTIAEYYFGEVPEASEPVKPKKKSASAK
jgi:hypothetical protein